MLRLQTECCPVIILLSSLQGIAPIHKITAVELDTGFHGPYFHEYAAEITQHSGGEIKASALIGVQHKIMIVSLPEFQLLVWRIDTRTDGCRLPEIERRSGHR